jgi:uncharacterized protein
MIDYSPIDQPSILKYIFYPREDFTSCPDNAFDLAVPVEDDVSVSCRFHSGNEKWPWILFFHGNGEVASDYDGIAPLYLQRKLNLAVADYRGYGASDGVPTLTALVADSHKIFERVRETLSERNLRSDLWLMGRSLGSISVLELAQGHPDKIKGLIVESGFASVIRIAAHLGITAPGIDLRAIDEACLERVKEIRVPALILHGGEDTLVPVKEARHLYDHLGSADKELLIIPSANHNDILFVGYPDYFASLQRFIAKTDTGSKGDC